MRRATGALWLKLMLSQKSLLRFMLWTLALGGALGAITVLTGGGTTLWRVTATTILTAVCIGVMIPLLRLGDRQPLRTSSIIGLCIVPAQFLLVLGAIWDVPRLLFSAGLNDELVFTALYLLFCGPPAMIFARLRSFPTARIAANVGLVLTCVTLLFLIGGAWSDAASSLSGRISLEREFYETAGVWAGVGLLLVASLAQIHEFRSDATLAVLVRVVGVAASATTIVILTLAIWNDWSGDSTLVRYLLTAAALAAHGNICMLVPLAGIHQWLRIGAILSAVATGVSINVGYVGGSGLYFAGDFHERLTGASGVLAACLTLALAVVTAMNRRAARTPKQVGEVNEIVLFCPGCGRKRLLPVGESSCPECRLLFRISLEEPHCPQCDYLLFRTTSDRCPECGLQIDAGAAPGASARSILPTSSANERTECSP